MLKFSENMRRNFHSIVRGGLSLSLLAYLLANLDWQLIKSILVDTNLFFLCISFFLVNVSILLSAFKWKKILRNLDREVKLGSLAKLYYEGTFLNNFFLSNIGGDGFKFFRLAQQIGSPKDAWVSIFIDRLSGLLVLISLSLLSLVLFCNTFSFRLQDVIGQHEGVSALVAVMILVCCALCFIFRKSMWSIHEKHIAEKNLLTATVLLVSVLFYALIFTNNYLVGLAYGLNIQPIYYLIFLPMIMILLFMPISINGVGLREMAFIFLFGLVGVEKETAFLLGVTPYILLLATSLMGGVFLARRHKRVPRPK
jgi:uncharacterized membrane protein YbhN (UPF0104 family)